MALQRQGVVNRGMASGRRRGTIGSMRFLKGWTGACNVVTVAVIVVLACVCAVALIDGDAGRTHALELAR